MTYFTAYHALRTIARVQAGEWVVVLGATGGIGLAAVDIAGALGARVFGAASTSERCAFLEQRGVEGVCNYSTEDLKESIKKVNGRGAQVTIDPVGGAYSEAALRALAWGGRFVVIGFASGEIARIPLNLVLLKGVILTGFENRTIPGTYPGLYPNTAVKCSICSARGASPRMCTPSISSRMWPERSATCKPDGLSAR